jgi:hypothetical protein
LICSGLICRVRDRLDFILLRGDVQFLLYQLCKKLLSPVCGSNLCQRSMDCQCVHLLFLGFLFYPALFSLLKTALAIQGQSWICMSFRIFFLFSWGML